MGELKRSDPSTCKRQESLVPGCAVRVFCGAAEAVGNEHADNSEPAYIFAKFVRCDGPSQTYEVQLQDGSVRFVPKKHVSRVSGRARVVSCGDPTSKEVAEKSGNSGESAAAKVPRALGHTSPQPPVPPELLLQPANAQQTQWACKRTGEAPLALEPTLFGIRLMPEDLL